MRSGGKAPQGGKPLNAPQAPLDKAVLFGYTVREQYEPAFGGIFCAPCCSSSLQYGGIAASSSRQGIFKIYSPKVRSNQKLRFCPQTRQGPQAVPSARSRDLTQYRGKTRAFDRVPIIPLQYYAGAEGRKASQKRRTICLIRSKWGGSSPKREKSTT